jgi:hypothetical protein
VSFSDCRDADAYKDLEYAEFAERQQYKAQHAKIDRLIAAFNEKWCPLEPFHYSEWTADINKLRKELKP